MAPLNNLLVKKLLFLFRSDTRWTTGTLEDVTGVPLYQETSVDLYDLDKSGLTLLSALCTSLVWSELTGSPVPFVQSIALTYLRKPFPGASFRCWKVPHSAFILQKYQIVIHNSLGHQLLRFPFISFYLTPGCDHLCVCLILNLFRRNIFKRGLELRLSS